MTNFARSSAAALALALFAFGGSQAFAQQAPAPNQQQDQASVREILSRAEAESSRRTIGSILSAIAGPANAQTAPPPASAPGSNGTTRGLSTGNAGATPAPAAPPIQVAQNAPEPQSSAPAAGSPAASGAPSAAASAPSGAGTPADPSMITRVPDGAADAPAQTGDTAGDTAAANPPADGAPAALTGTQVEVTSAPGSSVPVRVATPAPRRHVVVHRGYGYAPRGAWCAPYRW